MVISNNRASFHLRCKENFVKHERVSKYYENNWMKNFICHYVSLLTAKFVENGHI